MYHVSSTSISPPAPSEAPTGLQMLDVDATDAVVIWKPVDPHSINGPLQGYKVQTYLCNSLLSRNTRWYRFMLGMLLDVRGTIL